MRKMFWIESTSAIQSLRGIRSGSRRGEFERAACLFDLFRRALAGRVETHREGDRQIPVAQKLRFLRRALDEVLLAQELARDDRPSGQTREKLDGNRLVRTSTQVRESTLWHPQLNPHHNY